ncbi:MAG: hypothetical protein Q9214_005318, partial [Letrouitia sp. 1 TL-2023]
TKTEIDRLIDNLPDDIQGSYEILLQKCPDPVFTRKVLQIILVAARPLTLAEIDFALNVNEQTLSHADLEQEGSSRLQETLPSRCGLMVSIIQSKVYFIHQTVKEFLLAYSVFYWADHFRDQGTTDGLSTIEFFLENSNCSSVTDLWGNNHGNVLHVTSLGGHSFIVQMLLDKGAEVNAQGGEYGNALQAASYRGYKKVVQMLLENGAKVKAQGGYYGNALQAASFEGHQTVMQMLLDKGAKVNAQGGHYGNALQAASHGGHKKVVQMLLDKRAKVNVQGGHYGNALQAASHGGHQSVVQILLDKGAKVNAQGGRYENALQAASYGGYKKVWQMLLYRGAVINT